MEKKTVKYEEFEKRNMHYSKLPMIYLLHDIIAAKYILLQNVQHP